MSIQSWAGSVIPQKVRINTTYPGQSAPGWPASVTAQLNDVWIDFAVSPNSGYNLHVNSVSLAIIGQGTSNMKANIYISTDPNFTYKDTIFTSHSTTLGATTATLVNITGLDTLVKDGQKFIVRVYPWYNNAGSPKTTRYICIKDVVVKGTTALAGAPTVPATPVATAASNITQTSFTANWGSSTGATGYKLDVATDASFLNFVTGFNDSTITNVTSFSVTGLTANTSYYYRVRAYNSAGTSASSDTITVTTTNQSAVLVTGITISGGNAITEKGKTLQMTATVAPTNASNKTVTWSVDKATVATISTAGVLTAVANGTVVVTATANDGSGITGSGTEDHYRYQ